MSDRASAQPATDKLIGEVLANRYQIEVRLGEGAMGAVYKAKHVKVGRAFAVKILHPKLLEDHKVAQRFEREAELAGRLRHPNVVGVVDIGETNDGLRYMVMDFAEGDDLAELLGEAPMPAPRILNLTRQLLEGLYHAHEAGLIHRDFKPENVIVERDMHGTEVPRIVDFGIAILREGGDGPSSQGRLTTNGLVLGTPHYMAPEQAVADPIDHRIDLFALGIVVYEMLCGKLPFDGSGAEVARANLLLDPPPIAQRVPYLEVDPLLEAFSRRLMAKKRDHRPPTAKAARELLDLIERDRPAAAAALGVPLTASSRTPAVTEDVAPARPEPPPSAEYEVPALPPNSSLHDDRVTDRSAARPQRGLRTLPTPPLAYDGVEGEDQPPRTKRRILLAAGLGLAAVGGAIALLLARGDDDDRRPVADDTRPPAPVVMEPTTPPVPTPPDDLAPTPTETEPTPTEVVAALEPDPAPVKPDRTKPVKRDPKLAAGSAAATTVVKPVVDPPKPEAEKTNATKVALQYQNVGSKLKALGGGHDDLWIRWRNIRIQSVMGDPAKLSAAATELAAIEREISGRKQ